MSEIHSLADQIIRQTDKLKTKRLNFEKLWQEVSELVLPRRADFTVKQTAGVSRTRRLFETTAINSAEMLAAGLHGIMTNPSGKWFSLMLADKEKEELFSDWLLKAEQVMTEEIIRPCAGFATNIHEVYMDIAVLGTAGLYVGWNEEKDSLLFQSRFLGELFIDENPAGQIDTVFRVFRMSTGKIIKTWGEKAVPEKMLAVYRQNPGEDMEYEIIHAVMPNPAYRKGDVFQKPVSSVYVLKEERCVMFAGGFDEMPLFVTRWSKASAEVYGRSPAISTLPDIKMLQEMMKETIIAAQLANRPPLMVKDDDQFAPTATVPGGIIRYSGEAPKPFTSNANSSVGLDMMNEIRQRIRLAFYNDLVSTTSNVQMTATEVLQRTDEKMRLLGPVFGRLQTELFGPMICRVFGLLLRHGKIPPLPEELAGTEVRVEYLSPLSMAQKHLEAQAVMKTLEMAEGFLKIQPEAAAVFDAPAAIRKIGNMYGVASRMFKPLPEVQEKEQEENNE